MGREYIVNGETMVFVKGCNASAIAELSELGLSDSSIVITLNSKHLDIGVDDYGNDIPAEELWMLASANIRMTLVHFDNDVLSACISESMAGGTEGTMVAAGTPMGGGAPLLSSINHYIGLNLSSQIGTPWRFPSAYLSEQPMIYPLGTERSLVVLNWRAIPYGLFGSEITSSGVVLYDFTLDT